GDIINKLPGFEVSTNGSISYQGKQIEKYYIEGLDLLEGRYGIANKNLSHKAVRTVEVLENHQSIKMLDTLVFSDKTSINIRLKKNISMAGKAKLGLGASPLLWQANLTPMLFNKNQQAIASYQSNNIGDDVSEQLIPHYFSEMKNETKEELLDVVSLTSPAIDKSRYLDNNIHLLTYNHILKVNNDADLKVNTSYVNDYQKQEGSIHSIYFLADDTIRMHESSLNRHFTNRLQSDFIYHENSKKQYLKNKLSLSRHWDKTKGIINKDETQINQFAKKPYSSINNHLKWILPINKKHVTVKSKISYSETPQNLDINPGVFADVLNKKGISDRTLQHINLNSFVSDNSISFTLSKKHWRFDSHIGFEYQKKRLNSFIEVNGMEKEDAYLKNNLDWEFLSPYFSEAFRYETPNLNISFEVPIRYVDYKIVDRQLQKRESRNKLLVSPSFYLNYKINGYLSTNISLDYGNSFGDISNIHYGYLISNYRTLSISDIPLTERENYKYSAQLKYTNPIGSWYASLILNQTLSTKNLLLDQSIDQDGSTQISALLQDNDSKNTNVYFKGSKLIYDIGSTLFFNANYRYTKSERLSNGSLNDVKKTFLLLEPRLSFSKFAWMNMDYKYQYSKMSQNVASSKIDFINNNHLLNLDFFPIPRHSIGIDLEYYSSQATYTHNETYFANMNYSWKPKNTKMTWELKCYNLFDDDKITSYFNTEIASIINTYEIRPRQFIISLEFSL
ncbi:hypothetical protein, partial [Ancylomarina sp.]|uniref:hypothetical protein n=1 Tax=Ancylomarina sp. TaxID=1970196 RepID=UPI00356874E3